MILPNIENFIGCDSSFEEAGIVLYGAPFDSTTSFRPGARFGPSAIRHESFGLETYSLIRTATLQIFRYLTVEIWSFASAAVKWHLLIYRIVPGKFWKQERYPCF